jgi:CopG-like RHH_1 or ribbon-helix-helix domain, RHH_5
MVKSRPSDALSKKHSAMKIDHFFAALLELDVKTSITYPSTPRGQFTYRRSSVNVALPEDVLAQINQYAGAHGFTRSGLLAQAAKKLIA